MRFFFFLMVWSLLLLPRIVKLGETFSQYTVLGSITQKLYDLVIQLSFLSEQDPIDIVLRFEKKAVNQIAFWNGVDDSFAYHYFIK